MQNNDPEGPLRSDVYDYKSHKLGKGKMRKKKVRVKARRKIKKN